MNKLISPLILSLLLIICFSTFGQTKYKSKIVNTNKDNVIGAVVALTTASQKIIKYTTTDNNGSFDFEIPARETMDSLQIVISHLSYKAKICKLNSMPSGSTIILDSESKQLDDIVVTASAPLYTLEKGKMIVNISEVKFTPSDKSTDVLSKLPFLDIIAGKSITYENKTAIVIINGVEQKVKGEALLAVLKSISADQIDKVILSGNTLGQYDSSKSVIEINTKTPLANGYYGYVDVEGTSYADNKYGGNSMFSIFGKYNKLQANFSFQYRPNSRAHYEDLDSTIYSKIATISRNNELEIIQDTYQGSFGLTYSFDNKSTLSFSTNTYNDSGKTKIGMKVDEYTSEFSSYQQRSNFDFKNNLYTGLLQYSSNNKLPFHYSIILDVIQGGMTTEGTVDKKEKEAFSPYFRSKNTMDGTQYTGRLDMSYEINKKIELNNGVKYINGNINESTYYNTNIAASSEFDGRENTFALYTNLKVELNSKFFFGAGVRAELVDYNFNTSSGDEILSNSSWNWFPSINMTYKTKNFTTNIDLQKEVDKVSYYDLLPGKAYIDDYSYSIGNTQLKQSKYLIVSSNSTIFKYINLRLCYYLNKGNIDKIVSHKDGMSEFSTKNIGDYSKFYARLTVPFRFVDDKIGGYVTGYIDYRKHSNLIEGLVWDEDRNGSSHRQLRGSLWWDVTDRLNISSYITWYSKEQEFQYDKAAMFRLNLSVKYALLKSKKLYLSLSGRDITNSFNEDRTYYYDNIVQHQTSNNLNTPTFILGINWMFNKGKDVKKDRFYGENPNISRFIK